MAITYGSDGIQHYDIYDGDDSDLIEGYWYPHSNYSEEAVTPEFIERHISMRDVGYYSGNWPDIAASFGYCLTMRSFYEITKAAKFATRAMVHSTVLYSQDLNQYEQKAFDASYNAGYMEGQSEVAKQLYELALMGEFKAIDKYLEVRGAFGIEQTENESPVSILISEKASIEHNKEHISNVIPITKQS